MQTQSFRVNPVACTVLAVGLLAWSAVLVVIAVLGRHRIVPGFFDDLRIEHFLAFYVLAFLAAAGLPTLRIRWLFGALVTLAVVVEGARWGLGHGLQTAGADLICNIAGVIAALAPVFLSKHRDAFAGKMNAPSPPR